MADVKSPYRCPKCGSTALHQQLDKKMFNCVQCGAWFKLTKFEGDVS